MGLNWPITAQSQDHFRQKKKTIIRNPDIAYNIIIRIYIKAKNPSLIDLALAIILSLYAGLDLMWVVLTISSKIVYSSYINKSDRLRNIGKVP